VSGCVGMGSVDWRDGVCEAWLAAAQSASVEVPMPPPVWSETHQFRFLAALTPAAAAPLVPLPPLAASQFLWLRNLPLAV
jgi:hypothetical protein